MIYSTTIFFLSYLLLPTFYSIVNSWFLFFFLCVKDDFFWIIFFHFKNPRSNTFSNPLSNRKSFYRFYNHASFLFAYTLFCFMQCNLIVVDCLLIFDYLFFLLTLVVHLFFFYVLWYWYLLFLLSIRTMNLGKYCTLSWGVLNLLVILYVICRIYSHFLWGIQSFVYLCIRYSDQGRREILLGLCDVEAIVD